MRFVWVILFAACRFGPAVVEGGKGRVTLAVPFAEADSLTGYVAPGRPLLLTLQREESEAGTAAAELSLAVTGGASRVVPLGSGQSLVWLDDSVDYRLDVLRYGAIVGFERLVRVRPIDKLRVATTAVVETVAESCRVSAEVPMTEVVLHPNQTARIGVVAMDTFRQPLAGWLTLDLSTIPPALRIDTVTLTAGGVGNTLLLRPAAELGAAQVINLVERESRLALQITVPTSADDAPCELVVE